MVAVDGVAKIEGTEFEVDENSGVVSFAFDEVPGTAAIITAGFVFDVPVRFDTDRLEINLQGFRHGAIPNIPLIEIRL